MLQGLVWSCQSQLPGDGRKLPSHLQFPSLCLSYVGAHVLEPAFRRSALFSLSLPFNLDKTICLTPAFSKMSLSLQQADSNRPALQFQWSICSQKVLRGI